MRIRVKAPEWPLARERGANDGSMINGVLPSWADVQVFTDDGCEIVDVKSITLSMSESTEPIVAKIEVYVTELDIVCKGDIQEIAKP